MNKRTPVYRKFTGENCVIAEVNGYKTPLLLTDEQTEIDAGKRLALCDLTALNRAGFRGRNIVSWLAEQQDIVAPPVNQAVKTQQGLLVIRLSHAEMTILEDIEDKTGSFNNFMKNMGGGFILNDHPDIYYLPRQDSHSCFLLCGQFCAELFAKLCAVDLRTHIFPDLSVAQTALARASVIIIRRDLAEIPGYFILLDSSLAEYTWDCIADAMQEFDGQMIGYDTIRSMNSQTG